MGPSIFGDESSSKLDVQQHVRDEIRKTTKEYWFVIVGVAAVFATIFGLVYNLNGRMAKVEGQLEMLISQGNK